MALNHRPIRIFFFLLLSLAIAAFAQAEELVILYSGSTDGYVEPCG